MIKLSSLIPNAPPWPDAILYDSVARDFSSTGIFRYKIWGEFDPTYLAANFNNGPLFPALHLIMLKLFGTTDSRVMIILNLIFLLLATINIVHILRLVGKQRLLAALILCNPLVLNYMGVIRPEFLNLFFFTCVWRLLARPTPWRTIGAGVFLGLSALTHQFAVFFIPPALYLLARHSQTLRTTFKNTAILGLSTLIIVLPYIYYMGQHWEAFTFQLLHNQIGESVSSGAWTVLRSFVTPLFYPSISVYTLTGVIPRGLADGLHLGLIFMIVALVGRWRRHMTLSATTWDAIAVWFMLNLGCAVTTFSVFVTFTVTVMAIAMVRDVYPTIPRALRGAVCTAAILGISQQIYMYHLVKERLFRWDDYRLATTCIADALPKNAKVYVMAYPDPSVQLSNWRPDLDIRRYIDFPKYQTAWHHIVATTSYFITSKDEIFLNRFDHGGPLRHAISKNELHPTACTNGNVGYTLYSRDR